jgi:ATP-dependent Lon protease
LGRYHYILKESRPENREEILEDLLSNIFFDTLTSSAKALPVKKALVANQTRLFIDAGTPDETLEAYTNLERELLRNRNIQEREYSQEEVFNIEIRQLQCHIENVRALLVQHPVLPGGTHFCTSIQSTLARLHEKMGAILDQRNSTFPEGQSISLEDVRNRGSWFWDKELQDMEETGLNDAVRKQIDNYQKKLRLEEEGTMINNEIANFKSNVNTIIQKIESSPINAELSDRGKTALTRYKHERSELFQNWIANL